MKKLRIIVIGVLFTVCTTSAFSQERVPLNEPDHNKPKLFADLPQKMPLKSDELNQLFKFAVGDAVKFKAADLFMIEGTVISRSEHGPVRSIVIRSTNRKGAVFTLARRTNSDGSYNYLGRMMHRNSGDALEITQENGQLVMQKKSIHEMIAE